MKLIGKNRSKFISPRRIDAEQHLAIIDGLFIGDEDLGDGAAAFRGDLVHEIHGFDDANDGLGRHLAADVGEPRVPWPRSLYSETSVSRQQ